MLTGAQLKFVVTMRDQASAQMKALGNTINTVARQAGRAGGALGQKAAAMGKAGIAARAYSGAMNAVAASTEKLRTGLAMLQGTLVHVAAAFGLFKAIETIAHFGKEISTIGAVTGATGEQLERIRQLAIDMSNSTKFSATEAAEAMVELSRVGLSVEETMGALPGTLALAAAGNLDLAEASSIATETMKSFGMQADTIGHIADVLVKTAKSSNTTVAQLGQALMYAGGTAHLFGVSMEDTVASLAVLANRGRKASIAGSGLTTMFTLVARGGKKMETSLKGAHSSVQELLNTMEQGNFEKTLEILGRLSKDDIMDIFGTRAGPTAAVLVENMAEWRRYAEILKHVDGVAQHIAWVMTDNLSGALNRLGEAVQRMVLAVNQEADGALRRFVETLALLVGYLAGGDRSLEHTQHVLEEMGWNVEQTNKMIRDLGATVKVLAGILMGLFGVPMAIKAVQMLAGAFFALMNPLGLFSLAIGGAVGLVMAFHDRTFETSQGVTSFGDMVAVAVDGIVRALTALAQSIGQALGLDFNQVLDSSAFNLENWARALVRMFMAVKRDMEDWGTDVAEYFTKFGPGSEGVFKDDFINGAYRQAKAAREKLNKQFKGDLNSGILDPKWVNDWAKAGVDRFDKRMNDYVTSAQAAMRRANEQLKFAEGNLEFANSQKNKNLIEQAEKNLAFVKKAADDASRMLGLVGARVMIGDEAGAKDALEKGKNAAFSAESTNSQFLSAKDLQSYAKPEDEDPAETFDDAEAALRNFMDSAAKALASIRSRTVALSQDASTQALWNAAAQVGIDMTKQYAKASNEGQFIEQARALIGWERIAQHQSMIRQTDLEIEQSNEQNRILGLSSRDQELANLVLEEKMRIAKEDNRTTLEGIILSDRRMEQLAKLANAHWDMANRATPALEGLKQGWEDWSKRVQDVGGQLRNSITGALDGLTNAFVQFFSGQKADWKQLANSIIQDIMRIITQMLIMKAIKSTIGGDPISGIAAMFGFAKGGAFSQGAQAFAKGSAFANSIVSSPTLFAFKKGGMLKPGIMGEAGDEAVMPLQRMPNGRLGVAAMSHGGGGGGDVYHNVFAPQISVSVDQVTDPTAAREQAKQIADMTNAALAQREAERDRKVRLGAGRITHGQIGKY